MHLPAPCRAHAVFSAPSASERRSPVSLTTQASMPELPSGKRRRYADMGLPRADVLLLTDDVATAAYFEAAVEAGAPPKAAANWILGDIGAHCNVRLHEPAGAPSFCPC